MMVLVWVLFILGIVEAAMVPPDPTRVDLDYYELLGVAVDASERVQASFCPYLSQEIVKAFRGKAMEFHPDHAGATEEAVKRFRAITEAYAILSDELERKRYDEYHRERASKGPTGQTFKGKSDGSIRLEFPLDVFYWGSTQSLTQSRETPCPYCRGTGAHQPVIATEPQRGSFDLQSDWNPCKVCHGTGKTKTEAHARLVIPRGTVEGAGASVRFSATNINFMRVFSLPHPHFSRDSNNKDLHVTVWLLPHEALFGFHREIPHLDKTLVTLRRWGITSTNDTVVFTGRGMPIQQVGTEWIFGDLLVHFSMNSTLLALDGRSKSLASFMWQCVGKQFLSVNQTQCPRVLLCSLVPRVDDSNAIDGWIFVWSASLESLPRLRSTGVEILTCETALTKLWWI